VEWMLWVVLGGSVGVYLVVCIRDTRSYAARMARQKQRANGLKLLGRGVSRRPGAPAWSVHRTETDRGISHAGWMDRGGRRKAS
jgi:hypothetical protein